jgi:hypothetical protein
MMLMLLSCLSCRQLVLLPSSRPLHSCDEVTLGPAIATVLFYLLNITARWPMFQPDLHWAAPHTLDDSMSHLAVSACAIPC